MMKRTSTIALAALLFGTLTAGAESQRPYMFTQAHNNEIKDYTQSVFFGIPLQIQLPAGPTKWSYVREGSLNVIQREEGGYNSPDRIEGTDAVQVLNFDAATPGDVIIVLQASSLPPSLKDIIPNGRYVLKVTAIPKT